MNEKPRKMSDKNIDALFEKLDRATASKIDNQHTPIRKKPVKGKKKSK